MAPLRTTGLFLLAALSQLGAAWPTQSPYANIKTRASDIKDEYDYIVIGGGTTGLTVGDRLTEDGKSTVLVVEYGYFDNETGALGPKRMYNITSTPQPGLNGRNFSVGIGCVVGGSSSVNGQVFLRGTKSEYDAWAELGGAGSSWNWDSFLTYFKKGITLAPPDENQAKEFNITYDMQYWGSTSKIYAAFGKENLPPVIKTMYAAMKDMPGMTVPVDSGAGEAGLYWYPLSQDPVTWARSYARTGHWEGISRDNYEMIVGAKVNRILFDGDNNANGIQFISRNDTSLPPVTIKARKEVILAAGSIHTPQVLMLSGIGPSALLTQANITVKVNLPGVGSNFQDHSYIPRIAFSWGTIPPDPSVTYPQPNLPQAGLQPRLATMIGLPVISPDNYEALASEFETQDPAQYLPSSYDPTQIEGYKQQQKVFANLMRSTNVVFLEIMLYGPGGAIQNLHPMSRGTVLIDPKNPEGEMIVDYRAATNPIDLKVMVENIRFMRRYMTTGSLAQYDAIETDPGKNVNTTDALLTWARAQTIPSVYHPVGTAAKMPREWGGVVGEDLLVYGTKKLSIIDGSIFPILVGATTSMTTYAMAEKAADIIKARNA